MNGMYLGGRNIDGGTYPADIWGTYMKQAVGGPFCGDFKRPTEPFNSQPFKGHYASQGGKDDKEKSDDDEDDPRFPSPAPRPSRRTKDRGNGGDTNRGGDNDAGNNGGDGDNGAAFDPNQYETPPQGAPETGTPGGGTQAPPDG